MQFLKTISAVTVFMLPVAIAPALADGHIAAAMKERQSTMKAYGKNLGILGNMAKGQTEYDAEAATAAATELARLANADHSGFWIAGTDTSVKDSRALPALFDNLDDVKKIEDELAAASTDMVTAAGTDLAALRAAMGPVGTACGTCHKSYRQPK